MSDLVCRKCFVQRPHFIWMYLYTYTLKSTLRVKNQHPYDHMAIFLIVVLLFLKIEIINYN